MRKLLVLMALALPAVAFGQISASKHNLSAYTGSGTGIGIVGVNGNQICIYCHTPHNAVATKVLWNRANSVAVSGWTGGATTTAGTVLPTSIVAGPSGKCLSCHDGSMAVGDVLNTSGVAGNINTSKIATGSIYLMDSAGLQRSHPVGVPYPSPRSTYTVISAAPVAEYNAAVTAGCVGSTVCVSTNLNIPLYGTSTTTAGVECGSCHEPHNKPGTTNFMRISNAVSALCLTCHIK